MTVDIDALVAWLREALDEEAAAAVGAGGGTWSASPAREEWRSACVVDENEEIVVYDEGSPTQAQAEHIARWDPARVLAEVEAKRALLDWCQRMDPMPGLGGLLAHEARKIVLILAQPYAGRPGFRDEWRLR